MWQKKFSFISNIVLSAVIVTALMAAVRVQAATVTSANDTSTTLQTSQVANHSLLFTTSSGVSEGSTVTVHFDSAFNTSSLTEDDVDVADDGVELTTASSCAGTENASVTISANTVTFTICAGDGGAIASGSVVRIKIGTNAVSSGVGTQQVTNPSSAGIRFVSIAGSFGDSGSIALPIRSSADGVAVSAVVPTTGGGSTDTTCTENCNNDNQVDSIAPVISNIVVSGVTSTSASISWTTNEDSNSKVLYGLTSAFESGFVFDTALTKSHTISLSGLTEGKMYSFQVKSADVSANTATSSTMTFSTVDLTPPSISNISVDVVTKTSAVINWTTNESATSVLDYGLTVGYGSSKSDASLLVNHTVSVTGLASGTLYHYRVKSADASSNQSTSTDQTFSTLIDLPPGNVSGLIATPGDKTILLEWTNPTEEDFSGVRILRCLSGFPISPTDATCSIVADNSQVVFLNQNSLVNGTTYYYGVFAKDLIGQFASGALVLGKPSAPEIKVLKDVCGDKFCGATETVSSCPSDCTVPIDVKGPVCGDKTCALSETDKSCPIDCAVQTPIEVTCGNGVCNASESAFTCPSDCKVTQTPGTVAAFSFSDVIIKVGAGAITLPSTNGFIEVLPNTGLMVRVPATVLGTGVDRVTIAVGSETYIMRSVTALGQSSLQSGLLARVAAIGSDAVLSYEADITSPGKLSLHPVTIFVDYTDGKTVNVSSFLRVVAPGYTHEIIDGEETSLGGVQTTLYFISGSTSTAWDGSPYGQLNPVASALDGSIAWYVPNGQYRVHAEKEGYQPLDTAVFSVSNFIATPRMVLISLPKKEIVLPEPAITSGLPAVTQTVTKNITTTVKAIAAIPAVQAVQQSIETVQKSIEVIREIPGVQTAAQVSLPALAVSAGASVVVMSVAFDFLPFIQYLFTAPLLLFGRKKRKGFGVIYNAISKEPVGLAVVRLYQLQNEQDQKGKLVKSRVTDRGGRFFFLVQPGIYRLTIIKNGFQFPSELMKAKKEDVQYIDLYHGELVKVTEKDAVLTPNIPLDPSSADQYHEPKQIILRARLQLIQHLVALFGTVASFVFAIIRPSVLAAAMVLIQIAIYIAANRLAKPRKPKSWGIVYDEKTGRPVANVVARIFEPKYNKLLETQVTDSKGRYSFLLGPAEYFAVFEKEGYRSTQVNPIDYSKVDGAQDFSSDIKLIEKEQK